MSAFVTVIGGLDSLTESELRQLYQVVQVRLGIRDAGVGPLAQTQQSGSKASKSARGRGGKSSDGRGSKKGNPSRKSQWANNPLYQEYSRLKKAVETQAKEQKCSFNAVDTAESSAYKEAYTQWVEAKASFRDRSGHKEDEAGDGESSGKGKAPEQKCSAGPSHS